ncbi:hypothetical protein LWI28_029243 [Acer negundo]|uniref:MULE transposase domain-containing protein n=1 Tax=Acer negundo TaxID=4023 RepID=A0AAD5IL61_ACENE|nr:hypothetical protein LWI28_029243 [Acer negundo]
MIDIITFIIRSITGSHSLCQRQPMNREANSKWIDAAFGALILLNPSIEAAVIKNKLRDKFGVQASSQSIYRAKKRVLKNLRADHIKAYTMIWRYANMCIAMNPGTYAKVNTQEIIGENPRFQRLFLSFSAMQTGFVNGCRLLIGIDGCHLTSEYGGILLAATALDVDNEIFSIAYTVCETKCKESWIWFLRLLHESLDWDDNKRICFMSDRQKGILAALKSEWPTAKNRYCFRHVFANYNYKFKSLDLRKKIWRAAKVGHVAGFNNVMKEIREVSEKAHTWLMKSKPYKWARHKFEEEIKSDHVTNNMSECFNSWIKEDRDKPILTLFETLRRKVIVRFMDKWVEIEKLNDTITSYTRNRLNETDNEARKLQVIHEAFQAAYSGVINPIPDASRWPTVDNVPLDPPLRRTLVGRPKKNRRREPDEGPAAGRIFSNKYKKCGTIGHNKRACTDERKTADRSVVQQDGVTAARSGRKDGKDDEGIDTSSFHPRSWPHVLVREGRRQRGCLTANSGFTTMRGLDGDEWVSSLLISE